MKKVFVFSLLVLFQELMSKSYEKTLLFTTNFSLVKTANRVFSFLKIKKANFFFQSCNQKEIIMISQLS